MMGATLFDLPTANAPHPAKYSDALMSTFVRMLRGSRRILDPFGGTGKVFLLSHWLPDAQIEAVEIEPEWAAQHPLTTLGNALDLPWTSQYFDAICTSPAYGNHMADKSINATAKYRSALGRRLNQHNGGAIQWGDEYRDFHVLAWKEARRVLEPGGQFVLNIKDHIRGGVRQNVTDWHIDTLEGLGFEVQEHVKIDCPGMRYGRNGGVRIEYESVVLLSLSR